MDGSKNKNMNFLKKYLNSKNILIIILFLASILRLYKLTDVPVSLFGDELDVGYHAYSILKTGRDYMGNFMPLHFQSLAEYRTPLYLYSSVPSVAIWGISAMGVRLPAAIFGVGSIFAFYLLVNQIYKNEKIALIAAFVLTFSPWHIQYSRAAFEVTQLLFFVIFGFYMFFYSLEKKENNKYLWISALSFSLTPWIYSTAKLFIPFIGLFMFVFWFKELAKFKIKHLAISILVVLFFAIPMILVTFGGQAAQRFGYISIFTDPIIETEIGYARDTDLVFTENDTTLGAIERRLFHNKYLFFGEKISANFLKSFSTDFLFIKGDINLRHSIQGIGQFYRIEFIPLIIGLVYFFAKGKEKRVKIFLLVWIILGVLPSATTRDGGDHATRLILILPPLVLLVALGIYKMPKIFLPFYAFAFLISFVFYQHQYWIHNPWYSERWWHAGFKEAIQSVMQIEKDYNQIYITNASEPPWIFFAAWSQFPPDVWQNEFPKMNEKDTGIAFNKVNFVDKFNFGQVSKIGIYGLGKYIDNKTLYMAAAREIGANLIQEPGRTPPDLELVKSIAYPSGEPAFYLFKGRNEKPIEDPFKEE